MGYYLVDYENVKKDGLNAINKLTEKDKVCIFYSQNAETMTFGLHRRLNESVAQITFQKVEVGTKNALDFQLVTFLGYIIAKNEEKNYYIVTKDNGFNSVCLYWAKRNVNVTIVADVSGRNLKEEEDELINEVDKLLTDKEIVNKVAEIILQYKTKQGINNALIKNFPSKDHKQASEIYKAIKPLLKDKKGK
ncbi:MAG: PIN domain-containing protein [Erysipelotrichaceae bacterium]|nr:PIN domain-containing protein [Erysipelotrichaceae bacterium]